MQGKSKLYSAVFEDVLESTIQYKKYIYAQNAMCFFKNGTRKAKTT